LRWYGLCELAIGVAALVIPFEIQWLVQASAGFYSRLPDEPLLRYLLQFAVTLLVVGPPCMLMGGTLPLLIRELTSREGALDQATGWLYAINTFGAAAGCYLAGFQFLPTMGLESTNNLAAAVNIVIGIAAVWISAHPGRVPQKRKGAAPVSHAALRRMEPVAAGPAREGNEGRPRGSFRLLGLYVAVTLSGLGALVLEMTWSRQLALLLGGSTYAYSATLLVVLLGIAAGSLLFHLWLRGYALDPRLSIVVIGTLTIWCLVGKLLLPALATGVGRHLDWRATPTGNTLLCVSVSLILEFIPSLAMGILFPLFVDLTRAHASRVGRAVGDVYAWNTFGSIVGASLTAVLLFPAIGTAGSVALAAAAYVVALALVLPIRDMRQCAVAGVCLLAGAVIVAAITVRQNPMLTNMGAYMYGDQREKLADVQELFFGEGASSNVLVTRFEGKTISVRVNGKVDAADAQDMTTQLGLAYFPRLFNPGARDVLVIGFGSGTTLGASLLFPEARVTCCEIEPLMFEAAPYFSHINHRAQEKTRQFLEARNADPDLPSGQKLTEEQIEREARLTMVFGDGRTTLQGSDRKFDIIISEPSNPWLAGVGNLFTREFFQAARTHLNPGGVLAQWIQTYNFTRSDYLMIVRTMRAEFPYCGLISVANGADTVLLASDRPLMPRQEDVESMDRMVNSSPEITQDRIRWFGVPDLKQMLLTHYILDQETLDTLVKKNDDQEVNTDLNLRLEFLAPQHMFSATPSEGKADRLHYEADPQWMSKLARALGIPPDGAEFQLALAFQARNLKQHDKAIALFQKAIAINPRLVEAHLGICRIRVEQKQRAEAIAALRQLLHVEPDHLEALSMLAGQLLADAQNSAVIEVLERIVRLDPRNVGMRVSLCQELAKAARHEAAAEAILPAAESEPQKAELLGLLAQQLSLAKRDAEAAKWFRRALELRPELSEQSANLLWANNYAWLLATSPDPALRNGQEAVQWATRACQATNYKKMELIDTLAAAYAELGQFDEAVKYARQFSEFAETTGQPAVAEAAKTRLKLYESHQPFREA
ncbi:MAG: fused MFS/spermidine synthase, partial [Planctomycetia bacterium]|nr:fused MFS/spermidine synthase [Planctomycetia bacterium]